MIKGGIIDGKAIAKQISEELKLKVTSIRRPLALAIVQVGDLSQSNLYIKHKKRIGAEVGIEVMHVVLPAEASFENIRDHIIDLNNDGSVTGIILQLPLPDKTAGMTGNLINTIDPRKDVDGLTAHNLGLLVRGERGIIPATPKGIVTLCERSGIELAGKRVVVVGRSFLVGKSTALAFLAKDATITIAHSKTKNLKELTHTADIVVTAIGKAKFFDKTYFKKGQIVIDVGTNEFLNETTQTLSIVGDVDFHDVVQLVDAITPMPGGVGPMTVISLFENVYHVALQSGANGAL